MKTKTLTLIAALLAVFWLGSTALASEVSQGKTLFFDAASNKIQIEEYDTNFSSSAPYGEPTGIVSEYDLSKAKVGIHPDNGDVVRIAYRIDGDSKMALKVMNVSKQDLRKK